MNVQDIRLDIDKKTGVAQWVTIGQGDKGGTTIRATVFDNDVAAALTGMSARFEMRMPNATYFEDTNCTISGNVITYVVDESHAALYAGGESVAYFALYEGETAIYSTERFHVRVARAASDGANPGRAWTNGIEEWLDEASDTLDDAVADANSRVGATINAANVAVEGMRSDVDEAISDTEEVVDRAEDAIDAMGDISELAVPLMSPDTRGGAKLEEHGGLALRDGALGIGSLVQQSDGYARGGLAEVTAKGHAEQVSTTGKNLLKPSPRTSTSKGVTYTMSPDGTITLTGTATGSETFTVIWGTNPITLDAGTYTLSNDGGERVIIAWSGITSPDQITRTFESQATIAPASNAITVQTTYGITYNDTFHLQLELGSTATECEPYTGGLPSPRPDWEQPIEVVRGRNLLSITSLPTSTLGLTFSWTDDGGIRMHGKPTSSGAIYLWNDPNNPINIDDVAVFSNSQATNGSFDIYLRTVSDRIKIPSLQTSVSVSPAAYSAVSLYVSANNTYDVVLHLQLEKGDHATPYVPYGHVGMEVRDPDTDELISCTALPLPSRGWVAGLPDGTADSLRLDGAGKCEWELRTEMTTCVELTDNARTWTKSSSFSGGYYLNGWVTANSITSSTNHLQTHLVTANGYAEYLVGTCMFDYSLNLRIDNDTYPTLESFKQWLASSGFELLYQLATPIVEDCGYVEDWPTDIPEGATVTIPELDEVGIKYFVDSTVTELAKQWYARANSEYENRLQALEEAMATIITGS